MSDGTDDTELRQRVAQLEDRIESQQDTIEKLMPSRRSVVAGALGLGAFGAGTRYGSRRASAQAAGQVGTDADPVDVKAWDLDVQNGATFNGTDVTGVGALETEDATVSGPFSFLLGSGSELAGSRSFGTTYQNTTGNLLIVSVTVEVDGVSRLETESFAGPQSNPAVSENSVAQLRIDASDGDRYTFWFPVPDQQYYEVREISTLTMSRWVEKEAKSP